MTTYTYSKTTDFSNQKVNSTDLEDEIRSSNIVTSLDGISVDLDIVSIMFKADLSSGDKTLLDNVVAAHQGLEIIDQPEANVSSLGNLKTEAQPPSGVRRTAVSHDFCDPTTWYQNSLISSSETLEVVPNSNYKRYRGDHSNWIDLTHGKVVDEDTANASGDYNVVVLVNGSEKEYIKDYKIDYEKGMIEFEYRCGVTGLIMGMGALSDTDVVAVSYRYATDSIFSLGPSEGKLLRVASVEVQFTDDCIIMSNTIFAAFAYNPNDLPNKVEVPGSRNTYKTSRDFISVGNRGTGAIPKFGGYMRGLKHDTVVFPFDYKASADLKSSQGAEIRLWLEGDEAHQGEYCTCTFYCIEEDE